MIVVVFLMRHGSSLTVQSSFSRVSVSRCKNFTDQIVELWKEKSGCAAAVGLSVRSLFDLYLSLRNYPAGSEVIVSPPISVPGMMHVAKFHNLKIVLVLITVYISHSPKKHADDNEVVGTLPTEIWLLSDLREISFGKFFFVFVKDNVQYELLEYSFFIINFS